MSPRKLLTTATVAVLVGTAMLSTPAGAGRERVDVCHLKDDGTYRLLQIPQKAADKHLDRHADGQPGDAVPGVDHSDFGDDCVPELKIGIGYDIPGLGDDSFNDAANAGILAATNDFRIKVFEATVGEADTATHDDVIAYLAGQDPAVVFGVGFLYGFAVDGAAPTFPATDFVVLDSEMPPHPNVQGAVFREHEGSFLVGAAAALTSTSSHVGFIGGVSGFGLVEEFEAGFVAGAQAVDPGVVVDVEYLSALPDFSGFLNPTLARAVATSMYVGGADVVYHAAGGSGQGLFEAARDFSAANPHVWAIGVDVDQYLTVTPDLQPHILTSMTKRLDNTVYDVIQAAVAGDPFNAGTVERGLAERGLDYTTSGGFVDAIVPVLEAFRQDIIDGFIVVPSVP